METADRWVLKTPQHLGYVEDLFETFPGAVVIQSMFGIDIYASIITLSVLTGFYTIVGGLMAVVVTE